MGNIYIYVYLCIYIYISVVFMYLWYVNDYSLQSIYCFFGVGYISVIPILYCHEFLIQWFFP